MAHARITVEHGSWFSTSGGLLTAGVHETDNRELIDEARQYAPDWVDVEDLEEEALIEAFRSGTQKVVEGSPTAPDSPAGGPLTTADLERKDFGCAACGKTDITTQAALMSHRRSKHPDLDPRTGEPKTQVAQPTTQAKVPDREDGEPAVTNPPDGPAPVPIVPAVTDLSVDELAAVLDNNGDTFPQAGEVEVPAALDELQQRATNDDVDREAATDALEARELLAPSPDPDPVEPEQSAATPEPEPEPEPAPAAQVEPEVKEDGAQPTPLDVPPALGPPPAPPES